MSRAVKLTGRLNFAVNSSLLQIIDFTDDNKNHINENLQKITGNQYMNHVVLF